MLGLTEPSAVAPGQFMSVARLIGTRTRRYRARFCLVFLSALTVNAQNPPKQDEDDVIKVKSNLVNIDVIVKDKKGKYIYDLKPEDFTISENGIPQKIEFSRPGAIRR